MPITRPGHENETVAYRADIDGLRAVSILLVVGYHAQFWLVPGGFIGVDVFFVISGFLISRIILTELKAGTFSALQFYARRVRRIFPALIVVLAVTYLIGWFVLLPDGFSLLGKSIAAGVGFVSNLFQLSQAGYFAPDAARIRCFTSGRSASRSSFTSSGRRSSGCCQDRRGGGPGSPPSRPSHSASA